MKKPEKTAEAKLIKGVITLTSLTGESFDRILFLAQMQMLIWVHLDLLLLSLILGSSAWSLVASIGSLVVLGLIINKFLKEGKRAKNFRKNL